jgi:hypothetical protein
MGADGPPALPGSVALQKLHSVCGPTAAVIVNRETDYKYVMTTLRAAHTTQQAPAETHSCIVIGRFLHDFVAGRPRLSARVSSTPHFDRVLFPAHPLQNEELHYAT